MLYILRLTNGDCVITMAPDERSARATAASLSSDDPAEVATVRQLPRFAVRFLPTDQGSLEVAHWQDDTLDDILGCEYPVLNDAFHHANAQPFATVDRDEPILMHLKDEFERNTEIIRQGLLRERRRYTSEEVPASHPNSRTAQVHR